LGHPKIKKEAISSNIFKLFRFPLTAADILSSDNSAIIEFFLPEGKLYLNETIIEDQEV
jgi:hypothetical protein